MSNIIETTEDTVTSTIERLATGEELRAIADPERRLKAAAEVVERAEAASKAARLRRDAAAIELFRTGLPAVRVWKDTINVSRTLWGRILDQVDPDYVATLRIELGEAEAAGRSTAALRRKLARTEELAETIDALRAELAGVTGEELAEALRVIAAQAAEAVRRHDELAEAAVPVRNETAHGLISNEYGYLLSNADVSRMARVTTARVAQLRKSY